MISTGTAVQCILRSLSNYSRRQLFGIACFQRFTEVSVKRSTRLPMLRNDVLALLLLLLHIPIICNSHVY